jgi:hypothetical protein
MIHLNITFRSGVATADGLFPKMRTNSLFPINASSMLHVVCEFGQGSGKLAERRG